MCPEEARPIEKKLRVLGSAIVKQVFQVGTCHLSQFVARTYWQVVARYQPRQRGA